MQLYALDDTLPIIATQAKKEKTYLCPECKAPLKVRGGPSRQTHFYHLKNAPACRQKSKGEEHIALQIRLVQLIGETAQIEAPFPSIGRIADVAWHKEKIIFEIQYSPISLQEAEKRCLDYTSIGYKIIWILHDKQFNQRNLSAAEYYLRQVGSYFSNMNKISSGEIYDQFEIIKGHKRLFRGPKLLINLLKISPIPQISSPDIPLPLQALQRLTNWSSLAEGDLLSRLIQEKRLEQTTARLIRIETQYSNTGKKLINKRLPLLTLLFKAYVAFVQLLLRKAL